MLDEVSHILLILSGKGGVGKSTVCAQMATSLVKQGRRVGILDIDLCGPSIPLMFGVREAKVTQGANGWIPVSCPGTENLLLMSIGFLLSDPDSAIIWRGPKKTALISQFVKDVDWGAIDVLLIDTPPGTSDEHITVVEVLRTCSAPVSAVVVSTPQGLSVGDVRREIAFCRTAGLKIQGLVENMSGFQCPHCDTCSNLFSKGGGESLARLTEIPFLGCIPIDPNIGVKADQGLAFTCESQAVSQMVDKMWTQL